VVTCEGGITTLSCNPFPSQNAKSPGMSPLGPTYLKRNNHPIVVKLDGIGSCYASLTFIPQAFYPCYKLCDNMTKIGGSRMVLVKGQKVEGGVVLFCIGKEKLKTLN
jgi:hypothetical protein